MNVPKGIDIEGLSPEHKRAIRRIGYEAWLASYQPPKKGKTTVQVGYAFVQPLCAKKQMSEGSESAGGLCLDEG